MLTKTQVPLNDFLTHWGDALASKLLKVATPLHDPLKPENVESFQEKLSKIPRVLKPLPIQGEVIKALAKAFYIEKQNSAILVGKMGCGKTLMSLATSLMAPTPERTIICAPPHICPKWISEIKKAVPAAEIHNLNVKQPILLLSRLFAQKRNTTPKRPEYYVISREKAKLSYMWKEAFLQRKIDEGTKNSIYLHCSSCGSRIIDTEKEGTADYIIPLSASDLHKRKRFCKAHIASRIFVTNDDGNRTIKYRRVPLSYQISEASRETAEPILCRAPLWSATPRIRRLSPTDFIKKKMRNFFTLSIFDECHELESLNTLQGNAFGRLASACKRVLCLSGTIVNGYATPIFALLYRVAPRCLKDAGFAYGAETEWMDQYGVLETIRYIDSEDLRSGKGKTSDKIVRKRPGISPLVLAKYLLDKCVFITLEDISEALPDYTEHVVTLDMLPEQKRAYEKLEKNFRELISGQQGIPPFAILSKMLMSLLSYPDSCAVSAESIIIPTRDGEEYRIGAPQLDPTLTLPKESQLIELIQKSRDAGRRVLVFCTFTDTRDITPRIKQKLQEAGFNVAVLKANTVMPEARIAWFEAREKDGTDVVVCNPDLVRTGVDLYGWPVSAFYQTGYKLTTLRQASRRAYRINQRDNVDVFFFTYGDTIQEEALTLMAKKMEAALILEGELPDEGGLTSLSDSCDSLLHELARSLGSGTRSGSAEEALKKFRKKAEQASSFVGGSSVQLQKQLLQVQTSNPPLVPAPEQRVSIETSLPSPITGPAFAEIIRFRNGKKISSETIAIGDTENKEDTEDTNSSDANDIAVQFLLF